MRSEKTITRARLYRRALVGAEKRLWSFLRDRRFNGAKFRRQHAIGPYAVDFACVSVRLVIELDGPSHQMDEQIAFDEQRTRFLENAGWRVLRFQNSEVETNVALVGQTIQREIVARIAQMNNGVDRKHSR